MNRFSRSEVKGQGPIYTELYKCYSWRHTLERCGVDVYLLKLCNTVVWNYVACIEFHLVEVLRTFFKFVSVIIIVTYSVKNYSPYTAARQVLHDAVIVYIISHTGMLFLHILRHWIR